MGGAIARKQVSLFEIECPEENGEALLSCPAPLAHTHIHAGVRYWIDCDAVLRFSSCALR